MKLTSRPKDLKDLLAEPAMLSRKALRSIRSEATNAQLCSDGAIEIAGQVLRPDKYTAYIEFFLSHSFPVTTSDGTAIHPQVVANSYRTMLHKVFDFNHVMRAYDAKAKQDRMLGTIVAVEFPDNGQEQISDGRWTVQGDRSKAPGIRAVAALHKQAEGVPEILRQYFSGKTKWTVSMEQEWLMANSGFLVDDGHDAVESKDEEMVAWRQNTPQDLVNLGYVYVSANDAPIELLKCMDAEKSKITKKYLGREVIILFGGLDGTVQYHGTGLTWLGKEAEASVGKMLASAVKILGPEGPSGSVGCNGIEEAKPVLETARPDIVELLRATAGWEKVE